MRARQGGFVEKAIIDPEHALSISRQAEELEISRSTVSYERRHVSDSDLFLMRRIDELHLSNPFAGSRTLRDMVQDLEEGRRYVRGLIRRMRIETLYRKPNTSKPAPVHKIYPYLLRGLAITRRNQVWSTDIRMAHGFVHLAAVVDWFRRRILALRLSVTMNASLCIEALEEAIEKHGRLEDFQYRSSVQFASEAFTGRLKEEGIQTSMDGKGCWADNVFVERPRRSLKYEHVYLHPYESVGEAMRKIGSYFEFYNSRRPHSTLEANMPDQVYFNLPPPAPAA